MGMDLTSNCPSSLFGASKLLSVQSLFYRGNKLTVEKVLVIGKRAKEAFSDNVISVTTTLMLSCATLSFNGSNFPHFIKSYKFQLLS